MRYSLKRHPIPVKAQFQHCLVLAYAMPEAVLAPLLAPGLTLETYEGQGFLVVALVKTRGLRPAFLPHWLGQSYFLSGYRVFASETSPTGEVRRGLRTFRGPKDRKVHGWGSALLAHLDYRRAQVRIEVEGDRLEAEIRAKGRDADLEVVADLASRPAPLPEGSPFASYEEAKAFAGAMPWDFDYEKAHEALIRVEGERSDWKPEPVAVEVRRHAALDEGPFAGQPRQLAAAFYVHDLDYDSGVGVHRAHRSTGG